MRVQAVLTTLAIGIGLPIASAQAKLPAPTEEQKAKAEEAKAKAAEAAKKDAEALSRAQDRVAERYIKDMKAKGVTVTPTPIAVAAPPAPVAPAAPVAPKK